MNLFSKILIVVIISLGSTVFGETKLNRFLQDSNLFFKTHIKNGQIDYQTIKDNPNEIKNLVNQISEINVENLTKKNAEKAFLINVYNIAVIKAVIKHYPLQSVMDIEGFFKNNVLELYNEDASLDKIEKEILYKRYPDPRLHFVLVCAAIGCPQIIPKAYMPDKLEEQLNLRTKKTLNDSRYVNLDSKSKKVSVSELFTWYEKDFTQNNKTIIQYINMYRENKIPEEYKVSFITYDWQLNDILHKSTGFIFPKTENLQAYTPSTLLKPGQIELKFFNNLYTQTAFFDENSKKKDQNSRSTYYAAIINSLFGISSGINAGVDLYFKAVRNDESSSSPFSLFKFSSLPDSRSALTQFGPKLKMSPFVSYPNLAFQSTILLPLTSNLDGNASIRSPYLDVDGMQWWTQVFYDYTINNEFLLYLEGGILFRFESEFDDVFTPIKGFLNYYPSKDWTLYFPVEFSPFWKESSISAYYSQLGIGGKYQLFSNLELEVLFTKFIFGKSQGAGETFNFGIRFIN